MTKKFFAITLFALITTVAAFGITPTQLSVDVPFDFVVANRVLPAGHYTVDLSEAKVNGVMTLTARTGRATMVPSAAASQITAGRQNRIVFHRHAGKYFLSEISGQTGAVARRVPPSKLQKELASSTSGPYHVIAISAAR